jgi:hypothetical protein
MLKPPVLLPLLRIVSFSAAKAVVENSAIENATSRFFIYIS